MGATQAASGSTRAGGEGAALSIQPWCLVGTCCTNQCARLHCILSCAAEQEQATPTACTARSADGCRRPPLLPLPAHARSAACRGLFSGSLYRRDLSTQEEAEIRDARQVRLAAMLELSHNAWLGRSAWLCCCWGMQEGGAGLGCMPGVLCLGCWVWRPRGPGGVAPGPAGGAVLPACARLPACTPQHVTARAACAEAAASLRPPCF